ncbi:MAG: hypothetical protein H7A53_04460 [Akkermansiaceae bacterium]|nr:hypothetical protein [Akkermansiaceae bacterium]
MRSCFGDDVVMVFVNGASGDVTQVDNTSPTIRAPGEQPALIVGLLHQAREAVKVLLAAEARTGCRDGGFSPGGPENRPPRAEPGAPRPQPRTCEIQKPADAAIATTGSGRRKS